MPYGRNDRDFRSREQSDDRQRLTGRWIQDDDTGHLRRRFDDDDQAGDVYPGGRDSSGYGGDHRSADRSEDFYNGSGRRSERTGGHAFDFARRDAGRSDLQGRDDFEGSNRYADRDGYDARWDRGYDDRANRSSSNSSSRRDETNTWISRYVPASERSGREQAAGSFRGKGPKGYVRSDERIKEDVSDRLTDDDTLDASDMTVEVSGGEVTLSGFVDSRQAKRAAEECAEQCAGVTHVQNNLRVRGSSGQSAAQGTGSSGSGSGSPDL